MAQSLNSKPLFKKFPNYLMVESLNSKPLFKKFPNYLVVESLSYHQHDSKAVLGFFSVLVVRLFAKSPKKEKKKEKKREKRKGRKGRKEKRKKEISMILYRFFS